MIPNQKPIKGKLKKNAYFNKFKFIFGKNHHKQTWKRKIEKYFLSIQQGIAYKRLLEIDKNIKSPLIKWLRRRNSENLNS